MKLHLLKLAFYAITFWSRVTRPITLGVRIILIQEDKVLLVRHTYMPGWYCPGGLVNRYETPLEAAAREAWEETGVELLTPPEFLGLFTNYFWGKSDHIATYVCRKFRQGEATDRWEIAESKFFAVDALPAELPVDWQQRIQKVAQGEMGVPLV